MLEAWTSRVPIPFTTGILVLVIAILRPDLLYDMKGALDYYLNVEVLSLVAGVLFITIIIFSVYKLVIYIQEKRRLLQLHNEQLESERQALVSFFEAAGGPGWLDKTRWLSSEPVSRWKGVKVDRRNGFIRKLLLPSNRLRGRLDEALTRLEWLDEVDLRDNDLAGPLPAGLGRLRRLQGVYLHNNHLDGNIPFKELGELPLLGLYLFNNDFSSESSL